LAKEQVTSPKNVPQKERDAGIAEIDKCLEQVKKVLEFVKD
jgi:hypothetical protein